MFYSALKKAIQSRTCVSCGYKGLTRHVCPHAIGTDDRGDSKVFVYQYGGGSEGGLPAHGAWRCLNVPEVTGVVENDDSWRSSPDYERPNHCVTNVEAAVPPLPAQKKR